MYQVRDGLMGGVPDSLRSSDHYGWRHERVVGGMPLWYERQFSTGEVEPSGNRKAISGVHDGVGHGRGRGTHVPAFYEAIERGTFGSARVSMKRIVREVERDEVRSGFAYEAVRARPYTLSSFRVARRREVTAVSWSTHRDILDLGSESCGSSEMSGMK